MEGDERPEKRRKLDDIHDLPGPIKSQFPQEPGSQVTLGELKSNIPRVVVNKLNINDEVVEKLRQLTKFCGKRITTEKMGSLIANGGPNDTGEEITYGNHNKTAIGTSPEEIGCNESPDRDCKQGLPPHQNGMKRTETAVETKEKKFEDGTNNVEQAASDFLIFKQVLKEIIEQRTMVVEKEVAENSLKLQNRIRELERENRELQWNARRIFAAFRQLLVDNEKRKQPRTSRGVQVGSICELASEQDVSENALHITTAREINDRGINLTSTSVAPLISTASKVVTPAEDPQSSLQAAPGMLFNSQQPLTEKPAATAVVYTVKPRLAQLAERQNGISNHNRLHIPRPSANESAAAFLQGEPGKCSESPASKAFSQPPLAVQHQVESLSGLIREKHLKVRQQTQRPQRQQQLEQQRTSHSLAQSAQQHPSETTVSLLKQLQRQQQFQQRQQHYQKPVQRQPHTTRLPTSSQITDQVTPTFSVFSSQKQLDSTPAQLTKSQSQLVRPSDESQQMRQSANSPLAFLQQRNNSAIYQRSSPRHMHLVVNSQTKTVSVPSHSPVMFNTKQIDEVLKRRETALPPNGKSSVYRATAQNESLSQSTTLKQAIIDIQRSNLANSKPPVQNHINKHHTHHERLVLSAQPATVAVMEKSVVQGQTNASQRLVSTDGFHARPKSVGMQKHEQHPSSQLQKNIQSRQPPQVATQMQSTTETRCEKVSSPLSSAEITKHKPIQSNIASMQQTILVPARKKTYK